VTLDCDRILNTKRFLPRAMDTPGSTERIARQPETIAAANLILLWNTVDADAHQRRNTFRPPDGLAMPASQELVWNRIQNLANISTAQIGIVAKDSFSLAHLAWVQ
jgi:hypothetical protein